MEDRAAISAVLESGLCQARIARMLGRSPSRAPRPPGRRESHRGTLAALGQVSPHWGRLITCPNASFPTPMTRRLPQCTVLPAPMQSSPVQDRTTTVKRPPESTPTASLTRPGPNRAVPAVLRQEPTESSITTQPPRPLPSTCRGLGSAGSGASRLPSCLVVACGFSACRGAMPPSAKWGRAVWHQRIQAAAALSTSARPRQKPACADRRSLWVSSASHEDLNASATAPPEG